MGSLTTPRALRTRARILDAALALFEGQGYAATTVTQIAEAAGVTAMTFFRHFPTKESVVVTDPYDPLIADAVGAQPRHLRTFERVRRGLLAALGDITATEDATARRRVAIVASVPSLRAAVVASTQETQDAIVRRVCDQGAGHLEAVAATAACLGAVTSVLLVWTELAEHVSLSDLVALALAPLAPEGGQ